MIKHLKDRQSLEKYLNRWTFAGKTSKIMNNHW